MLSNAAGPQSLAGLLKVVLEAHLTISSMPCRVAVLTARLLDTIG